MDDAALAARESSSIRAFYAALSTRVEEVAPGVQAAITPARPRRSILNGVVYATAGAVDADVLARLDDCYAAARVHAWLVWVRPGDTRASLACAAAGLRLDGRPMLMAAPMEEIALDGPVPALLEGAGLAEVAAINDAAYAMPPGAGFAGALETVVDGGSHVTAAAWKGRAAACAVVRDHAGDAGVYFVGTVPAARGHGLATGVVRAALRAARNRGMASTSLEASAMGERVYRELGYRSLGRFELWERRL